MIRSTLAIVLLTGSLAAGCGEDAPAPVTPVVSMIVESPVDDVFGLPDGRILYVLDGDVTVYDLLADEATVLGPVDAVGRFVAAEAVPGGASLLFAERGVFLISGTSFVPSPLSDVLDAPVRDVVTLGDGSGALWILTGDGLFRLEGDVLTPLLLDVTYAEAQLARGTRPGGDPALWVVAPEGVLEVAVDLGTPRVTRLLFDVPIERAIGDAEGLVWLLSEGRLYSFGADRSLDPWVSGATRLVGTAWAREAWAIGEGGDAWVTSGGEAHPVPDVSVGDAQMAIDVRGALLEATPSGLRRLAPRRPVDLDGPADGSFLVEPTTFPIRADAGYSVEAFLDGEALEIDPSATEVPLEPATLTNGVHELTVRVAYDDGTLPAQISRRFEVISSATWTGDIGPIYDDACASCHGQEGPALTLLDEPDLWQDSIQLIIDNVRDGRMPLGAPPLDSRAVAVLEAWRLNGFPQQ